MNSKFSPGSGDKEKVVKLSLPDENNLESTIENLRHARESLINTETFYRDTREFQTETLKTLTQLAMEAQSLRERLLEVVRLVQGADNPDALHLQFHLFKGRFQALEADIKSIKSQIESHDDYHTQMHSTRDERGWQTKSIVITAVVGVFATVILIPLLQLWFPFPTKLPNTEPGSNEEPNPWRE